MIVTSLEQSGMRPSQAASGQPESGQSMRDARTAVGYGVATALMLISPLLVFAPAALFQCALRNGRRVAWGAFTVAVILTALYFMRLAGVSEAVAASRMAWASLTALVLSIAVPSMAATPLVERGERFGTVLTFALTGSTVGLGLTEIGMRTFGGFSPYALQLAQAQQMSTRIAEFYRENNARAELVSGVQQWMQYAMQVLPAWIVIDFALIFVLSLMMVGRLKAWSAFAADRTIADQADRPYLFRNLALPEWLLFGFVFGGLTPIATGPVQQVAANVLAVVVFLFLLQGLAVFRFMLVKAGTGVLGTIFGFLLLALLCVTGFGLLLLVVAGLFDPFFDFRKLKRKDDSHESHTD
ncbi:MAG TPA: DUF2232 domain-containing protein [Thermoanaerobaculia bacterium]|nr:DUF2232 domain-containing protein [Thermoanaerobaculia bacterium]